MMAEVNSKEDIIMFAVIIEVVIQQWLKVGIF